MLRLDPGTGTWQLRLGRGGPRSPCYGLWRTLLEIFLFVPGTDRVRLALWNTDDAGFLRVAKVGQSISRLLGKFHRV